MTALSAADALHAEEVRRTRVIMRTGWIFAAATLAALPFLPGDPRIALALAGVIAAGWLGSMWMYRRLRDPAGEDSLRMNILAVIAVAAGQLGILYTGVVSAAPLAVALGLYFFCRTENTRSAVAIYVLAAGMHAATAALVIAGVIDDPGFYPLSSRASIEAHIAGQLNLQLGYGLCFWLARITRASSLRSIDQLQRATRLAAQRDAQVAELRLDLAHALEVGGPGRFTDHVVGAWQLGVVLGRGSMGEVYAATHVTSGAEAAVKLLRRELLGDARQIERFLREVHIASSIESPHVVRVLEAGSTVEPLPFLAMERLRGETLGDILRKGGTLGTPELRALVQQIASVLELARAADIVHRDLKPQNLFRTEAGAWKVLDFGVALRGDGSGTLTRGGVIGTPAYMAPEQAKGEPVDHRADVYALAAIVYRCVTGRAPLAAGDTMSLLYAAVHQMPLRPSAVALLSDSVARALDRVLVIALAKARELRFATAGELADAVVPALEGSISDKLARRARMLPGWQEPESVVQ
jgi:eukaryotic-like serine/threonine-protein kinase